VSELLVEVTIFFCLLFCCDTVCYHIKNLLCLDLWVLEWAYFRSWKGVHEKKLAPGIEVSIASSLKHVSMQH